MESRIRTLFFKFFHRVIPPEILEGQPYAVRLRAYILVGFILGNIILSLMGYIFALFIAKMGQEMVMIGGALALFSLVAYALILRLFVATRSFLLAGNAFAVTACFAVVVSIIVSGGYQSPVLEMLVMIPIFVFLMAGRNAGITWMVIVLLVDLTFYYLDAQGVAMPQLIIHPSFEWLVQMASWLMLYISIISALVVYDSVSRNLSYKLEKERNHFEYQAAHDSLTGLFNRSSYEQHLEDIIYDSRKNQSRSALALIDLDDFKKINDQYGHLAGDEVLKAVAARLKGNIRTDDVVARIGGDEFAVILKGIDSVNDLQGILEKILLAVNQPIRFNKDLQISCSIGVAFCPEHGEDEDTLTHRADEMLYAAKSSKNMYMVRPLSNLA